MRFWRSRVTAATSLTLGSALVLLAHAWLCWRMLGGWDGLRTPYPIVRDDHTFNYYYAVTTRDYLASSGSSAGYDPFFMSGYAKSIIYPTSSTLAELVLFLSTGAGVGVGAERDHAALAYKLFVIAVAFLCPIVFWLASKVWTHDSVAAQFALLFYLTYFWSDIGVWYIVVGMVPYVLAGSLALLATAAFARYVAPEPVSRLGTLAWWLMVGAFSSFAVMVHLTVPIAVAPAWVAILLCRWRELTWRRRGGLAAALVLPPLVNAFWLIPGIRLWSTKGRTDIVFVNENVIERLWGLVTGESPVQTCLAVLAPLGIWAWSKRDRASAWGAAALVVWCFALGYLGGWFRALDFLQPGRYTLYLYTFASLGAGIAAASACRWSADRIRAAWTPGLGASFWLGLVALGIAASWRNLAEVARANPPVLETRLPRHFEELILFLRANSKPGERLLFEDRNRGIIKDGWALDDPFQSVRPAPLLPLLTGLEVIGGPYLYTHQKTNFTQAGDGWLWGLEGPTAWDPVRFEKFARWYDLAWLVAWSPEARAFCHRHPELVNVVATFGPSHAPLLVARLNRAPHPAIVGQATVTARPGRIEVENARPEGGELVLRYHWVPGLVTDPPTRLDEYPIDLDPVGLIRIHDPPPRFTIRLDPWGTR